MLNALVSGFLFVLWSVDLVPLYLQNSFTAILRLLFVRVIGIRVYTPEVKHFGYL